MRTGKRRSAKVIISRGLPGILCSFFVLASEYALTVPRGVNAKICHEARIPIVAAVALGVRSISDRMTRNREDRSSNEKAPRRREEVKRGISRPSPLPKPKERPASKGRVHMGKTRN